ncbi:hypothetical protein GCM10020001_074460 [Nonomuraea salmonea]
MPAARGVARGQEAAEAERADAGDESSPADPPVLVIVCHGKFLKVRSYCSESLTTRGDSPGTPRDPFHRL